MANIPEPVAASRPPAKPEVHWLIRVIRLVLVGVLLYFGWTTYLSYREMLSGDTPILEEIDPDDAVRFIPELLMDRPESGSWVLAGLPLQVESTQVEDARIKTVLNAPLDVNQLEKSWPIDDNFRVFLSLFRPEPMESGKGVIYRADGKEQRIAIFTRFADGKEYLVGGRLAKKGLGEIWSVLQARSAGFSSDPSTGKRLLPFRIGTQLLAERMDAENQPLAQVVLFKGDMSSARTHWQERGWRVRKVKGWEEGQLVVCYKEGESISALAIPGARLTDPTALLLVRLPEPKSGAAKKRE